MRDRGAPASDSSRARARVPSSFLALAWLFISPRFGGRRELERGERCRMLDIYGRKCPRLVTASQGRIARVVFSIGVRSA